MDPRARLLATLLLFGVPLCLQSPLWLAPLAVLAAIALLAEGGGPGLRAFIPMLAIMFIANILLWPAFVPGTQTVWGYLTREGMEFGIGMGLRLTVFAMLGMLYLVTAPVEQTAWALNRLGMPYVVSFGIVMAFRLMERIGRTAESVVAAQRSRGLTMEQGSRWQRWRSYVPLLVPILVLSMRRVDGMAMAMESRAFTPTMRRTSLMQFTMHARDWVVLLLALAALIAAIWLRLSGWSVLVPGRL